ncbi:MAG: sensor histidine kinase [Flavobacteriaceae bacterium]
MEQLLQQDYTEAKQLALSLSDVHEREGAVRLAEVLFWGGQGERYDFGDKEYALSSSGDIFFMLAHGYQNLYYNRDKTLSYTLFRRVYDYAKERSDASLTKLALISILEVYNHDVVQTNESYQDYLEELQSVMDSPYDEYHYRMFLLNFELSDIHYTVSVDNQFFTDFDLLMEKLQYPVPQASNYLSSKGVYFEFFKKDYGAAKKLFKRAITYAGDIPFLRFLKFRSYCHLAQIAQAEKKHNEAIKYLDTAGLYKNRADSVESRYHLNYYLAANYGEMGQWEKAFTYQKSIDSIGVRLAYEKNASEIAQLNTKYQTAEKEKQILKEQQRAKANRNWLIAVTIALVLGAGIAILLQQYTRKKRQLAEQEALLKQQRVENLLREQELVSIDAMIAGQEKERQRVANELHDDLGSLMATIRLHFENVNVSKKDPALKNAQKLLEEAYQKIRGMAHSKNSGVMSDQGLLPAVEKMARTISQTNALQVTVEDFGMGDRLENSLELTIFRIIQELVANVIKHAGATKANIQITQHEDNLNIIVEDNGKGFDRSKLNGDAMGMGLTNIEKRVEHLEGSFTVDSIISKGTSILIDIPV